MTGIDKRRLPRAMVRIPVMFSVILPEQTFSPVQNRAIIVNLSASGAMVETPLPSNLYSSLLEKVRYCRIEISEPAELAAKVTGKAVWIQPTSRGEETVCQIGLYFENLTDMYLDRLQAYVAKVLARQGAEPVP